MNEITKKFLAWYDQTKRPLPWRDTKDPYKIWVSEVFLQQTQASRVVEYYTRMIQKYPTVESLAATSWEEFLPYFQGLGFYSRGRNMLVAAKYVVDNWEGKFPPDVKRLQELKGVGEYTARAICSFAYGQNVPAFDTNLYRVMRRFFGIARLDEQTGKPDKTRFKKIEKKASYFYDSKQGELLNHAFMDLGSRLCLAKKVECNACPLNQECDFFLTGKQVYIPPKKKKKIKAQEFSVMVLHHNKKYFLVQKENKEKREGNNEKKWGFPIFFNQEKKDQRHFLKHWAMEKWGLNISVRPPFYEQIIETSTTADKISFPQKIKKLPMRLKFSRCQILNGEIFENKKEKFFTLEQIAECQELEKVLEGEVLGKILGMRF